MPTSPQEMMAAMMKNLAEKTGHDLNHWLKVVKASGEEKHMAIIKHLKSEHGLTHGYANFIAFKEPLNCPSVMLDRSFIIPS